MLTRLARASSIGRISVLLRSLVALGLASVVLSPAAGAGAPVFVITGGGYGHGVGMSQWGAYGQAKAGRDYRAILSYYYRGTALGHTSGTTVRVLVVERAQAVTIGSDAPFVVTDGMGKRSQHDAGDERITANAAAGAGGLTIAPATGSLLHVGAKAYRGTLRVLSASGSLQVINVVGLEPYLRSVVAGEMPSDWPAAALEAQAVAARTYALARTISQQPFDLYADTRSQVYGGASIETPAAIDAVAATALRVVLYEGKPATTFFFASSGGRTASAADVFALDLPYLVPVADPWDKLSPDHVWASIRLSARQLRQSLALPAAVTNVATEMKRSGRPSAIALTMRGGKARAIPADEFRTALDLRSTRFRVGQLSLDSSAAPVITFGASFRLTGTASGVPGAALEARSPGGEWRTLTRVRAASDGTFAASVRPRASMSYRLVGAGISGPRLSVEVAPRVHVAARRAAGTVAGVVVPKLPGATVVVERLHGDVWRRVTRTTVTNAGAFAATAPVGSGTYRARVMATAGFAEGESPAVSVS